MGPYIDIKLVYDRHSKWIAGNVFRKPMADISLRILKADNGEVAGYYGEMDFPSFRPSDRTVNFPHARLLHRDIFGRSRGNTGYCSLSTLVVRAEMKFVDDDQTSTWSMDIMKNRHRQIYESGVGCDFALVSSDGTERRAHKSILSIASPVFERMFKSNLAETRTGRCVIEDVSTEVLDFLLRFMYYGSLDGLKYQIKREVLVAADKYEILDLKKVSEDMLKRDPGSFDVDE